MAYAPCACPDETHCGLRMIMLGVRNAIAVILDRYTLGDLVGITRRKPRRAKVASPFAAGPPELAALLSGPKAVRRALRPGKVLPTPTLPVGVLEQALSYDI